MKGDTETGRLDHRNIVGAVADRQGLFTPQPQPLGKPQQSIALGVAAEHRLRDLPGEPAGTVGQQYIGVVFVEADGFGERRHECGEAAGDHASVSAVGAHGSYQRCRPGIRPDTFGNHLIDGRGGKPLQQRHPLAQRGRKRDLAPHRTLGDRRDAILNAGIIGELVDAFLADHGRIHVGDQKLLATSMLRLNNDVDGRSADDVAQLLHQCPRRCCRGAGRGISKQDIDSGPGRAPSAKARLRQHVRDTRDQGVADRAPIRSRD